jgi:nitrogen fixation protein NifU and related proteins
MSQRLDEIYSKKLKEHYEKPRNYGPLDAATSNASMSNPLCGDQVFVHIRSFGGKVRQLSYEGHLCAVSLASASMMSTAVKDKSSAEIKKLIEIFEAMMKGNDSVSLGELDALRSVRRYRVRVRCALLPWEALRKASELS